MTRQFDYWQRRPRPEYRRRSGAVLVVAMMSLLIVMALLGTMLQGALRIRRHLRAERDLRQTEFLLQAGADRAAYRLTSDPAYRGEVWDLPARDVIGNGIGQVTITASREADGRPWHVRVVAEYPVGNESSIRRSRAFQVPRPSPL